MVDFTFPLLGGHETDNFEPGDNFRAEFVMLCGALLRYVVLCGIGAWSRNRLNSRYCLKVLQRF